ncbi:Rossmann fold nucleotide-binding protein [Nocardioides sp. dk4132]|uniref:LOG family protein n=1 Tax=unclassified Nocardioides TaxID=2615069 RepID=UPI001295DD12|nr:MULTISPECIES: Rossmann fold nucleotide-binding protein [unclassified Nocardioides]MQW77661.1 Rossmann fold nucleotide-binding protein [Nocardioides sp. dk4132]QGA07141.1 Rossmann fold nucleotide-binding protein [Nocardioides sp. dk884]
MEQHRGRIVDIDSLADLDRRLAAGARSLSGWRVRTLDLTGRIEALRSRDLSGATFLGCTWPPAEAERARAAGAVVLDQPPATDLAAPPGAGPVEPPEVGRTSLYTVEDLYDAPTWAASLDGRAYAWSQRPATADSALRQALHDHAIDQALQEWAAPRRVVGVMGGHAARRGDPTYRDAARLAQALGARLAVATGGGPGAMEAANLGAWYAAASPADLDDAVARLSAVPSYRPSIDAWVTSAREVRADLAPGADSLGIPTWHYGHEPPNLFATAVAKYFRNSTREAILLQVCDAGIVFLPGAGGTVQEIFQDACENYYADESSLAPMVLVGREYWTSTLPAWPLLETLARGRPMEEHVHLVDSGEEAAAILRAGA